jgi:hypothetical protein
VRRQRRLRLQVAGPVLSDEVVAEAVVRFLLDELEAGALVDAAGLLEQPFDGRDLRGVEDRKRLAASLRQRDDVAARVGRRSVSAGALPPLPRVSGYCASPGNSLTKPNNIIAYTNY